ncbi:flagellar basal body rod protein FlgG [Oceanobacillus piezotolerans]|uniref:Flagellar hook protein FlgE n=1 Tax=Oceanobacillus piezotolerans TaxID=2448030 RepID=A0A498DNL1_9BACI|nr:flagellar basal body rod protein FlgG [Oceanobacillus piezotolerans]RLL45322.1 flagellar basal body rod protein FlgG [Oceanobacillus piezotolerans]
MLRSMYAGISGMKNFQTKLDVIGNNIANVNTTGFKKGRVTFQEMMSQTMTGAQGPVVNNNTQVLGGINASQVGLGSQLGTIDNIQTQGFRQTTNNPLDFAIEGDGMFVLARDLVQTVVDFEDMNISYSRAGNFYLDEDGNVVNPQGLYLIGYAVNEGTGTPPVDTVDYGLVTPINIPDTAQSFSVQTNGTVNYIDENGNNRIAGQVALANFSNPAGLLKDGGNLYLDSENAGFTGLVVPEQEGAASIISGSLEMSNVDLAEEFTEMITAQRGFQANTRIITTSDEILQELVNLKR